MWPLLLLGFLVFATTSPTQQSESYHAFADQRNCCCVPNAMDVSSNLLFLFVGLWRASHAITVADWIFAGGVVLTAFGSVLVVSDVGCGAFGCSGIIFRG